MSHFIGFVYITNQIVSDRGKTSVRRIRQLAADEISSMCRSCYIVQDYHFMICVDINDGQPVCLSQRGYLKHGSDRRTPFSITRGLSDTYLELVPMFAFIKKA